MAHGGLHEYPHPVFEAASAMLFLYCLYIEAMPSSPIEVEGGQCFTEGDTSRSGAVDVTEDDGLRNTKTR